MQLEHGALKVLNPVQLAVEGAALLVWNKAGKPDFIALWAGQGAAMSRALPAAELIARLEKETEETLARMAALLKRERETQ